MKSEPRGRVVPTPPKHKLTVEHFRRITWRERIKILCGFNLVVTLDVLTAHRPGDFTPNLNVRLTKEIDPLKA